MNRRIVVVGTMGSGKTTLARQIAARLGLLHVELDAFYWGPGWKAADGETLRTRADEALAGEAWVVDGNHADVRDIAWGRADTLVWLDYPPILVLNRLLRRTARRMLFRTELWEGNRERLGNVFERDSLVFWLFANHAEKRRQYPALLSEERYAHLHLVRLRSPRAAWQWLAGLSAQVAAPGPVLHVADYGGPYSGNFIASLRTLGKTLEEGGARQTLVLPGRAATRPWLGDLVQAGALVYLLPEDLGFIRATLRLWRIAHRERTRLLHVHFGRYDIQAWLAAALLRLGGRQVAVLWHEHGGSPPLRRGLTRTLKDTLKLRLMGRFARAVAVSDALAGDLQARGMPADRIYSVSNGIDLHRPRTPGRPRADVRAAHDTGADDVVFLLFGWDPHRKGVDLALDAMPEVVRAHPQAVLWLAGKPSMEEYVRARTGAEFPSWLRLVPPAENVADLYAAADVFLSPSREEGMPYSVAEAMAAGLPAILSAIPGHARYVEAAGVLSIAPEQAPALAAAATEMLAWKRERCIEAACANREWIEQRFSIDAWTREISSIYSETLTPDIASTRSSQ